MSYYLGLFLALFVFTLPSIAGSSMLPTLYGGSGTVDSFLTSDRVLMLKYKTWLKPESELYKRGELVLFREPADSPFVGSERDVFAKRIIAIPGDTVSMVQGDVYVNNVKLDQTFITAQGISLGESSLVKTVLAQGEYFVLGDNRRMSVDSRIYGSIERSSITGSLAAVVWPPVRNGRLNWKVLNIPAEFEAIPNP